MYTQTHLLSRIKGLRSVCIILTPERCQIWSLKWKHKSDTGRLKFNIMTKCVIKYVPFNPNKYDNQNRVVCWFEKQTVDKYSSSPLADLVQTKIDCYCSRTASFMLLFIIYAKFSKLRYLWTFSDAYLKFTHSMPILQLLPITYLTALSYSPYVISIIQYNFTQSFTLKITRVIINLEFST